MKEKLVELLRQCVMQNVTTDPDCWGAIIDVDYGKMADSLLESGVVALPCKVGDTLYCKDGKQCEVMDFCIGKNDGAAQVNFECNYDCENCAFNSWHTEFCGENSCDGEWGLALIAFSDIGKTVFLTREEAEAALKEGQ